MPGSRRDSRDRLAREELRGRYGVSVYDPALKRKRWVGTFPTLREARAAERNAAQRAPHGRTEDCDVFALRWVDDYPRQAAATTRTYRYALTQFAKDLSGEPLAKVD